MGTPVNTDETLNQVAEAISDSPWITAYGIARRLTDAGLLCTQEERRLLDEVAEAIAAPPDPEIDRIIALADAERDVVNAAIEYSTASTRSAGLYAAVSWLLHLRAQDTAAAF